MIVSHRKLILAALLFPGALLLALPEEQTPERRAAEPAFQVLPEFAEQSLLYSGPASFSLPLVVPLESAIGHSHLASEERSIRGTAHFFGPGILAGLYPFFPTSRRFPGFARIALRANFLRVRGAYFDGRFNWQGHLLYMDTPGIGKFEPGDNLRAAAFAGYAPRPLKDEAATRPPVNLLLGLTADYHYADVYRNEELTETEYGTVFLAPGLQLAGRRMLFEATVELPVRRSRAIPDRYRDKVRGNIGMKYFLR